MEKRIQYNIYQCEHCKKKEPVSVRLGLPSIHGKCPKAKDGKHKWIKIGTK